MLRAAIAEPDLWDRARRDFGDMLDRIDPDLGDFPSLTERQRAYVEGALEKLGVDAVDLSERNANVPRGREVPLNFGQLPMAPPGRTSTSCLVPPGKLSRPAFDPGLCSLVNGGTEQSCLHCGGLCPKS